MLASLARSVAVVCTLSAATPVWSQEFFGSFLDQLRGVFDAAAQPRPTFRLESEFRFRDPNGLLWSTPAGAQVDGASIPQAFWSLIGGPFEGAYINASVIHDHYCRTRERTAHDTHRNFYYGMRAAGVEEWRAKLMHWVVDTFGPSWKIEKRVLSESVCTPAGVGTTTCTSVSKVQDVLVTYPGVDLSDPEVLAAAVSKTNAIARTLRTSGGRVLDVSAEGQIPANVDSIARSAENYRNVFATKEFSTSRSRLGLLSGATLMRDVQPWAGNRIPGLAEARILTPETASNIPTSSPFRLDERSRNLLTNRVDVDSLRSTSRIQDRIQ